jgi:hypothetical protein
VPRVGPSGPARNYRTSSKREREEVIGVITNDATYRRSCGDGYTTVLNRGGRGAPMGRWLWARGREIGARMDAMDNGVLSLHLL